MLLTAFFQLVICRYMCINQNAYAFYEGKKSARQLHRFLALPLRAKKGMAYIPFFSFKLLGAFASYFHGS